MFPTRTPGGAVIARPRLVIINCALWSAVLTGASLAGWYALPAEIRALFTAAQVATLLLFLAFILGFLWTVGLSYVRADDRGLRFRNGLRTHERTWRDVRGIRFRDGDPWAFVELEGPVDRLALMGIMRTDGARAERLVADLRELQALHRTA